MVTEDGTKNENKTKIYREIKINNPFIREENIWDKENELFDKIKVRMCDEIM
jgi:hypothetical protein